LIAKETINNSIKYAACTRIQVRISSSEQSLILEIRDNGQGFDTSHASTGYGLKNVCQRAEQIRYSASIVSERGVGTTTIIQKK
jgi:signal transduction histidine kinase